MSQRRRFFTICRLTAVSVTLLTLGSVPSRADAPPPAIDHVAQNQRPKFLVHVWITGKKTCMYNEGDTLKLNIRCEEDAFLYVLYQQADGKTYQIFPNSGHPDNQIKGMQDVHLPDVDDAFRWVITPPLGHEVVKVIASKKPVDALSLPGLKEQRFNPVTGDQIGAAAKQLAKEPENLWTENDIPIQTVPKGVPTEPDEHKRFGVFFGVAKYEFNDVKVARYGEKADMNLRLSENDAEDTSRVFRQFCGLADSHTYCRSDEVTKERMRAEITEWLPSVSQPGDTVFIYFSGHGAQIVDDDGDDKDQTDELLITYNALDVPALNALLEQRKQGQLVPQWESLLNGLDPEVHSVYQQAFAAAGGDANQDEASEKASKQVQAFLLRRTAVSDDEMGHWLQKLDGRHVVVMADACHSGGMAATGLGGTKGLEASVRRRRPAGFTFLKKSLIRLKDLNQPSLTLLAAATEPTSTLESSGDRNSWFTTYVLERLNGSPGPVDTQQVFEHTKDQIARRFVRTNARRLAVGNPPLETFEPMLTTTEPTPVVLKPAQ
jgi:hypothetical protein